MAAAIMLFFLLSAVTLAAAAQQRNSNIISLYSSLTPTTNSSWFSPSGIFAFGFYQLQQNGNGYAICISFASFSERTVVWTANRANPILPNNVNSLVIDSDGLKLLQERDGGLYIYSPIASPAQPIRRASMLDNGNFVLHNSHGRVIWQSFDHPTDTLLPGQRLSPGGELFSRASETDLSIGLFRLKMQTDGNLVQYPVRTLDSSPYAYYESGTYRVGNNVSLNLENDGHLYLLNGSSVLKNITRGGYPVAGAIYLTRIDVDGIFRLYSRSLDDREGNLTSIWSSTKDKCVPKGLCGFNSFCILLDQIVDCKCLPGFDFVGSGKRSAGCARNFMIEDCANNRSFKYEIREISDVVWEDNSYDVLDTNITQENCGQACLDDCNCDAAFFKDGQCRKQRLPLKYGRRSLSDSNMALVKVSIPSVETTGDSNHSGKKLKKELRLDILIISISLVAPDILFTTSYLCLQTKAFPRVLTVDSFLSGSKKWLSEQQKYVITGVPLGIAGVVISSIIIYYISKQRRLRDQGQESNQNVDKFLLIHGSLAPKRYSYNEIKKITKSFRDKLGQGGYGIVYKGEQPDGQTVAVKVLTETHDNAEEFINEVASISRTSHVNIVSLLGFCYERKKRALVYEYMPNKSLDKFIYKSGSVDHPECSLDWDKLYEIAVGVARGLEYLHRGCTTTIVHFDIKPQNILLDEEFCPKISDFGLAKLFKKKQSTISMFGARGTVGFMAPEVFSRNFGVVSHKSDVYSYGMMLLQMAEARKIVEIEGTQSSLEDYFPEKIYEHILLENKKTLDDLLTEEKEETVRKMLLVGIWCIQTAPSDRPSMTKVLEMLEGSLQSIQIPPKPFLSSSNFSGTQFSSSFSVTVETENSTEED